jgi:hypothetical protein
VVGAILFIEALEMAVIALPVLLLRHGKGEHKMPRTAKNRLKINCPEITASVGEVLLNGKPLRDLISLRIDIPESRTKQFIKVTAELYSAVDVDTMVSQKKKTKTTLELVSC